MSIGQENNICGQFVGCNSLFRFESALLCPNSGSDYRAFDESCIPGVCPGSGSTLDRAAAFPRCESMVPRVSGSYFVEASCC